MAQKSITEVQNRVLGGFAATLRTSRNDKNGGLSSAFTIRKSNAVQSKSAPRYAVNSMMKNGLAKEDIMPGIKG